MADGGKKLGLSPETLKHLVCPVCRASIEVLPDERGLRCATCHRVYPVRDGIAVLLASEAKIEESAGS